MSLEPIIDKFNRDNTQALEKIMKALTPTCKAVENARKLMFKVNPNNLDKVKEIEIQVTGHFMQLQEIYSRVYSLKKNKELAYYQLLKNHAESNEKVKFVATSAEKEAALSVADERRVRDYIDGYLKSAAECLKTCRNLINEKKFMSQSSLTGEEISGGEE